MREALGLIETFGLIGAVEAADVALKAANVKLLGLNVVGGGLVTVLLSGDVAAVRSSVDAASAAVPPVGRLVSAHVIPRLSSQAADIVCETTFPQGRKKSTKEEVQINEVIEVHTEEAADAETTETVEIEAEASEIVKDTQADKFSKMTMKELRKAASGLSDFPMKREQIYSARKIELVTALTEYYNKTKN